MTSDTFNKLLERKLADTRTILAGKAEEYSHGGDRLSNFKRAAGVLACTPEQVLLSFVTKHVIALYDFVQALGDGRCMTLDQWAEKTGDIRNYMILLDALIEERLVPRAEVPSDVKGYTYHKLGDRIVPGDQRQDKEGNWHDVADTGGFSTAYDPSIHVRIRRPIPR